MSSVAVPLIISLLGSSSSRISKADSCSKLSASPVSSWKYRGRKISFLTSFLSRYLYDLQKEYPLALRIVMGKVRDFKRDVSEDLFPCVFNRLLSK